jgi:hypothetical protein
MTKKLSAYFGNEMGISAYVLTTQVFNTLSWTPPVVKQRQHDFMDVLYSFWHLE